jgi:P-type E1-E2 ATPase
VVCRRNETEDKIHYDNLLVGDIVKIKSGMNIPVDGIVITSSGVAVNESAMTGESDELKKEAPEICRQR